MEYCFQKAQLEKKHVLRFSVLENSLFLDLIHKMKEKAFGEEYASKLYGDALFLTFLIELNPSARILAFNSPLMPWGLTTDKQIIFSIKSSL